MKFSLVIPCFNEENSIPILVKKLEKIIENKSFEVILVDNGSTDNTFENLICATSNYDNLHVLKLEKNEGYGNGILKGLQIAKGEILAWTHADLQTNPEDVLRGLKFFENDKKNIFVKGLRKRRGLIDNLYSLGMSFFSTIYLKKFLWDINAQPTIFSAQFFKSWVQPPKDFTLDLFAYYFALKKSFLVYRFPVTYEKRLYGESKWNFNLRAKIRFIKIIFKFLVLIQKK